MFDVGTLYPDGQARAVITVTSLEEALKVVEAHPTHAACDVRPWIEDRTGWRNAHGRRFRMVAGRRLDAAPAGGAR